MVGVRGLDFHTATIAVQRLPRLPCSDVGVADRRTGSCPNRCPVHVELHHCRGSTVVSVGEMCLGQAPHIDVVVGVHLEKRRKFVNRFPAPVLFDECVGFGREPSGFSK